MVLSLSDSDPGLQPCERMYICLHASETCVLCFTHNCSLKKPE